MTGGELVTRVLAGEGVRHLFTLCGGHILPIYDACLRDGIQVIDVRHEQAAHAADAYARLACARAGPRVRPGHLPQRILDPTTYRREGGGSLAI